VSPQQSGGWSFPLPWKRSKAPIFSVVVSAAAGHPGVRWAQLLIRDDLVAESGGKGRILIPVADRAERVRRGHPALSAVERQVLATLRHPLQLPRWLSRLKRGAARVEASTRGVSRRLAFALHVDGHPAGILRLLCTPEVDGASLGELAQRLELRLEGDLLRLRLAGAEAHYRTILEAAGDAILIVDARSGRVVEANRQAATMTRYREADLVGRVLWSLLSDNAREALSPRSHRSVLQLLRRRGNPLPVAVTFARVPGPRPLLHLILSDVASEERARRELTQAKETLGAIAMAAVRLQTPSDRRAVFDVIGRELARLGYFSAVLLPEPEPNAERKAVHAGHATHGASRRWEVAHLSVPDGALPPPVELLGATFEPKRLGALRRALVSGRPVFSNRPAEALRRLAPALAAEIAKSVESQELRGLLIAPMGQDTAGGGALLVAGPTLRQADAEGVDAFARQAGMALERARLYAELRQRSAGLEAEVERRTRELTLAVRALREVDRRKDNFLANVSHELRTPLVTVLGYSQLILSGRMGPLTVDQERCLRTAYRNGQRLKEFIDELVDFSRHELTREALRPEPFDIRQAVEQATAALYPRLLERRISLNSRIAPGTPPAFGERDRMVQVLSNLLFNAERHCQPGGRLRVAVSGGRGRVRVSVADNGSGIAPEHRERIFERLYQVGDRALAREKGAGLGLGLAIAKSIVEAHGGRIWVDGRLSRGSRFRFEIPSAELITGNRPRA
jgi:PAS domain S-box-containing protein